MEVVKKTENYTIYQKRSKRYAVRDSNRRWINGDEKVKILLKEKLIKAALPKPKKDKSQEKESPQEEPKE